MIIDADWLSYRELMQHELKTYTNRLLSLLDFIKLHNLSIIILTYVM